MSHLPPRVAVVTDSTSCLGARAAPAGVTVLPLMVAIGANQIPEVDGSTTTQVLSALRSGGRVSTSQPPPAAFDAAYRRAADAGAQAVVSVHLSAGLSGTYAAARAAAGRAAIEVHPIDSQTTAMALGAAALGAAMVAGAGADVSEVAREATRRSTQSRLWLATDTLDFLRRGGRYAALGRDDEAAAGPPVLTLRDGRLALFAAAGSYEDAIEKMAVAALAHVAGCGLNRLWVHYGADEPRANDLASALAGRMPAGSEPVTCLPIGAVLAAHAGPGALAIVAAPQ